MRTHRVASSRTVVSSIMRTAIAGALALALTAGGVGAQEAPAPAAAPAPQRPVFSMGQPPLWQTYGAALGVLTGGDGLTGARALLGIQHPVLNPVTGLLGLAAEGYATAGAGRGEGGARLLARSRALAIGAGVDWSSRTHGVDLLLTWQTAVRRGGLLGHGTMLRLDWLPARHSLGVGVTVPLDRPFAGRTRPRRTAAHMPTGVVRASAPAPALSEETTTALETVAEAARLIRAYTDLYSVANEKELLASVASYRAAAAQARAVNPRLHLRYGQSYDAVRRAYGEALAQAFAGAAGGTALGDTIAARARAGVLDQVLLAYDSLFGRAKSGPQGIAGLTARAQASFARWVRDSAAVPAAAVPAVLAVHARWLHMIEDVHRGLLAQWKDSRLVWLPLQLALAPEDYDEQVEVDQLIGRAVGGRFTDRNALTYLRSIDLPLELARSIYAARDYHVLWVHDFRGVQENGALDDVGYSMVADAYLPALTAAVQRYDSTGHLPVYMILLDEFYYEAQDGRLWMNILEDPLHASIRLPGHHPEQEAHLRERQRALLAAVAASPRLRRDATRMGGEAWIRRVVKVNVNITQPADFSFRSRRIVPPIPFTPDDVMRDHRKIAFYDLNEADPYRGAMFVMGVGIGEHYASATWEDRGYRLRGPAALQARAEARRLLRLNGFREEDIPAPLREVRDAARVERSMDREDYIGRALQVHNEPGFGAKRSSVARAMLYSLAPPGSVIIVPDPLWLSADWAAMLAAAAARGCRVYVIAPALANAPSPEAPAMAQAHDVMLRLLQIRERLGDEIEAAGGELRVGIFAGRAPADDAEGRRREVRAGLERARWIRELIPFDSQTVAVLDRAVTQTAADGGDATGIAHDVKPRPPQLHQKTQLVARPGAITALVRQPGWDQLLARAMRVQSRETARFAEQLGWSTPELDTTALRGTDAMVRGFEQSVPEAERRRVSFYFALGTQNEDPRGMVMDGEATVIVSGFHAAAGLVDLYFLMARSDWVDSQRQLEHYLPAPSWLMRKIANIIRPAL